MSHKHTNPLGARTSLLSPDFGLASSAWLRLGSQARAQDSAPPPRQSSIQSQDGRTKPPPPPPNTPTASSIHIDDAILKACGIEAPKAHFAFDSANVQSQDTTTLEKVAKCFSERAAQGPHRSSSSATPIRAARPNTTSSSATRAPTPWAVSCDRRASTRRKIATTRAASSTRPAPTKTGWARDRRVDLMLGQ